MDKTIPLDVVSTLRQLGINPTKAMELLAFTTKHEQQAESELQDAQPFTVQEIK